METVRIRPPGEFPPEMQRMFEGVKRWFALDFVPKMNLVTAYDPAFWAGFGRCGKRAMADGALPRDLKEMIAVGVSAINACDY
ncbi:MAG: carboxymuconolactone decarboxylase family protein [Candidatus Rokuibacteriota bacterium]